MASLLFISTVPLNKNNNNVFPAAAKPPPAAAAAANEGRKKGLIEWLTDGLQKPDQFFETDPILQKAQEKEKDENGRPIPQKKGTAASSQKKKKKKKSEGFGGLFAKK